MDYAYKSTYDYAENSPIQAIDLDGLEKLVTTSYEVQRLVQSDGNYSFKTKQLGPRGVSDGGNWSGYRQNNVFFYEGEQVNSLGDIPGYKEFRAKEQADFNRGLGEGAEIVGMTVKYGAMVATVVQPELAPLIKVGETIELGGIAIQIAADISDKNYEEAKKQVLGELTSRLIGGKADKLIKKMSRGDETAEALLRLQKELAEEVINHENKE